MRIYFFVLITLIAGSCQLMKTDSPVQRNIDPALAKVKTQLVYETLKSKPDWLFSGDACPADIIPQDEKDIEYLNEGCADEPKACLENCESGDGNACYALGLQLQDQQGVYQEASEMLFLRACKFGIISGCTNRAAGKFNIEKNNAESIKCAANTFEKTCSHDDPWGCTMFGIVLAQGLGRKKDLDAALKVMSKSCRYGDEDPACQEAKKIKELIEKAKSEHSKK